MLVMSVSVHNYIYINEFLFHMFTVSQTNQLKVTQLVLDNPFIKEDYGL